MARTKKFKTRPKRQQHDASNDNTEWTQHRMTMQQEARFTEGRNLWRTNSPLRSKAVLFVSAGNLARDEDSSEPVEQAEQSNEVGNTPTQSPEESNDAMPDGVEDSQEGLFFTDTSGDRTIHPGLPDPVITFKSSDAEPSSEDEVLFRGRGNQQAQPLASRSITIITESRPVTHSASDAMFIISSESDVSEPGLMKSVKASTVGGAAAMTSEDEEARTSHKRRTRKFWRSSSPDITEDVLADYIANIDQEYQDLSISAAEDPARRGERDASRTQGETDTETAAAGVTDQTDESEGDSGTTQSTESEEEEADVHFGTADELSDTDLDPEEIRVLDRLAKKHAKQGTQRKERHPARRSTVSASALADALDMDPYAGFDIMDFDRPSLRKKQKGKQRAFNIELSDSGLEEQLEVAWQNDRERKKLNKQRREQLRIQGLLGRPKGKPDMSTKYSNGMGVEDLKEELRTFLLSQKESLALPPMSKQHRKLVHDMANSVALKSQSRGNGSSRFPILYKTGRTPKYSHNTIREVERILSRGKFNRLSAKSLSARKPGKSSTARPTRADASVSYMDGEVVGAAAPEIGAENKGRAMLEKMGWSTGTALGATNNKGILLPVAHVVRSTRAGLG